MYNEGRYVDKKAMEQTFMDANTVDDFLKVFFFLMVGNDLLWCLTDLNHSQYIYVGETATGVNPSKSLPHYKHDIWKIFYPMKMRKAQHF